MTPPQLIVAILGNGPCTETRLISGFMNHGYPYEMAKAEVTNALCTCLERKLIEMPVSGVYRLSAKMGEMEKGQ
jgi:hypothetical protein